MIMIICDEQQYEEKIVINKINIIMMKQQEPDKNQENSQDVVRTKIIFTEFFPQFFWDGKNTFDSYLNNKYQN